MSWLSFALRFLTLAVEILRWRKKKEEEDHAQAVADTPKTKDELAERLRKGNV